MKQLKDSDIANMIGEDFIPDDVGTKKSVRAQLHLSKLIPQPPRPLPEHAVVDFHQHTEEEAWSMLMDVAMSGVRRATIITGASGILKQKFQQWATESILSPYIVSVTPINNGSFDVVFIKSKKTA